MMTLGRYGAASEGLPHGSEDCDLRNGRCIASEGGRSGRPADPHTAEVESVKKEAWLDRKVEIAERQVG